MDGLSEGSHKVIIKHPWNCSEFTPIFSQGPPTPPMPLVPVPFRSPSRSSGPCGHRCLDVLFSFQIHFHRGKKDQLNEGSSSSWEEFLNLKCTLQWGFLDLLVTFHINAPPSALQAPSPPAWFSVNAKCWLGAWRSQHLRQNWVGLFRVPKSTISETCWRGTAMMIFGHTWPSGLFQFINLKVKRWKMSEKPTCCAALENGAIYPTKPVTHGEHHGTEQGSRCFNAPRFVSCPHNTPLKPAKKKLTLTSA